MFSCNASNKKKKKRRNRNINIINKSKKTRLSERSKENKIIIGSKDEIAGKLKIRTQSPIQQKKELHTKKGRTIKPRKHYFLFCYRRKTLTSMIQRNIGECICFTSRCLQFYLETSL